MTEFRINKNVTMGQYKNGMHYGEIKDNNGYIESACICKTSQEVIKWLHDNNVTPDTGSIYK